MADPFGVIDGSIWRSRKFRPRSPIEKLVYLYLHASPHRNAIGLYRLPVIFAADDLDTAPDTVRQAMASLTECGLIDYDEDEPLVRIRNWELRNAPENPQTAINRIYKGYDKSPKHRFTFAAFLNFAVEINLRAERNQWKQSDSRIKMEELIFRRAEQWYQEFPHEFAAAFPIAGVPPEHRLFDRVWDRVSHTQPIPAQYPMAYKEQRTENREQRTETQNRDTDHGSENREQRTENRAKTVSKRKRRQSPPKGGAPGGTKTPDDILSQIEALKAKARGET